MKTKWTQSSERVRKQSAGKKRVRKERCQMGRKEGGKKGERGVKGERGDRGERGEKERERRVRKKEDRKEREKRSFVCLPAPLKTRHALFVHVGSLIATSFTGLFALLDWFLLLLLRNRPGHAAKEA